MVVGLALVLARAAALAQTFDSGSNGSDGALDFTPFAPASGAPEVTVNFDPSDPKTFDHPTTPKADRRLDADRDNTYHFTTITVPARVVVRLSAGILGSRPLVWLASGDVTIAGKIDLNGSPGAGATPGSVPAPALAGAGGYPGGQSGMPGVSSALRGSGPGGGLTRSGPSLGGGGAGHAVSGGADGGIAYGNPFLLPIWGGSGGAAGASGRIFSGGGGGGGGGALVLAASGVITANGTISADGGNGGPTLNDNAASGGGGSGGAIRLIAGRIAGAGKLSAQGGTGGGGGSSSFTGSPGAAGRLRLETFARSFTGTLVGAATVGSAPGPVFLPANAPMVRVQSIGTNKVPASPLGNPAVADVSISEPTQVPILIEAQSVPLGTLVNVLIDSDTEASVSIQSTALAGTLANSTATATASFPAGVSRIYLSATWNP